MNATHKKTNTASLLFNSPDEVGIIAALSNFFSERDLNISRYAEYTDDGQFFSRLEWSLNDRWEDENEFSSEFAGVADKYNASFDVRFMDRVQSVGLFVSKQAHALIEMLNKYEANYFPNMEISFIVGNDESMRRIADRHGMPFFYIQVLSENFIESANCPIINIHHSFLPSFVGAKPYQMAYERGVKLIGATSHFVTPELDQGPIIEQNVGRVAPGACVQDMIKMGRDIEQKVFAQAMLKVLEHKAIIYKNRTIIFN